MRILVADQNALLLAAIASTFGRHCVVVTATRRATCLEHLSRERFDVVVACEKLHDYTGLELLSEMETLAPQALCIFSAPAPRLAQLQARLDHFRLLGTLSYPIEPRKLLMALKVARSRLPARPKVRHVVLESEWDTGERLGILERELEVEPAEPPTLSAAPQINIPVAAIPIAAPSRERPLGASFEVMAASLGAPANDPSAEPPPPPPPPPVDTGGAANEPEFASDPAGKNAAPKTAAKSGHDQPDSHTSSAGKSSAGKSGTDNGDSKTDSGNSGAKTQAPGGGAPVKPPSGSAAKKTAAAGPPPRKQAVPSAAQREAFKRAQARRQAARNGFFVETDTTSASTLPAGSTAGTTNAFRSPWLGTQSLTDLARMATTRRPLPQGQAGSAPKRNVIMVGSGVAAVVLASVLAFQLTRSHAPTHPNRQAAAQLFSPNPGEVAQNGAATPPPEVFGPPPGQTQQMAAAAPTPGLPQPPPSDPNSASSDAPPPPPTALEHPGAMMMQPSMDNSEPPPGIGNTDPE
jgi:hypothetical protein